MRGDSLTHPALSALSPSKPVASCPIRVGCGSPARHRTRAQRARSAGLARSIGEQRAPPGSTTLAPVDPPPIWGNSVIGSGEIRAIVLIGSVYGNFGLRPRTDLARFFGEQRVDASTLRLP